MLMKVNEAIPVHQTCYPFVSIIIPVHNGANTLPEQLDALKCQQYDGDWEILVVNNCSTDDTVKLVQAYQSESSRLRFIHAPAKQSKGYACNVGASAARGEAFIFCDQDDVAAPGWVAAFGSALAKHSLAAGTLELEDLNSLAPWRPVFPHGATEPIMNFLPHVSGCNIAVTRAAFEAVDGFAEDVPTLDDIDFTWRLQLQGYRIHDVPEAVLHYRYRRTYRGLWRQIVGYGEAQPHLFRRFAGQGMPRSSIRKALRTYKWLIKKLPCLLFGSKQLRARWIFNAAACWGRLRGSLHYRSFYP